METQTQQSSQTAQTGQAQQQSSSGTSGQQAAGSGQQQQQQQQKPTTAQRLWGGMEALVDDKGQGQGQGQQQAGQGQQQQGQGEGQQQATQQTQQQTQQQGTQQQQQAAGEDKSKIVQLTPEQLEAVMTTALTKVGQQSQGQGQQQQQLSQEEFDKVFNVYRPTPEVLGQIMQGGEGAIAAFTQALHGASKMATTIASFQLHHELKALREEFQPALQHAQAQQLEKAKTEFFQSYPDLKGLEPLLMRIRDGMVAKGVQFKSKEEAFKTVAEEARALVKSLGVQTTGQQQQTTQSGGQQQQEQQTQRQMAPLSSGKGGGGAGDKGAGASNGTPTNTAKRIFG